MSSRRQVTAPTRPIREISEQRQTLPALWLLFLLMAGCGHLERKPQSEFVYVLAKQTFLRDRVAAVSNRVAQVQNGQRLELLERGRRFLRVKTDKGEIGWIEEHAVVNPEVVTGFEELQKAHPHDPVIATAVLRDDGYLHLKPGRDTDRFYLLPEGDKLQLLVRASVPKAVGPQASGAGSTYASKPSVGSEKKKAAANAKAAKDKKDKEETDKSAKDKSGGGKAVPAPPATPPAAAPAAASGFTTAQVAVSQGAPGVVAPNAPPTLPNGDPLPMEDWWLVRDSTGRVGWVMSRRLDVDVPDEIAGYAEGQRIVGAYLLKKVDDPESNFPDKQAPEYVTVLNPYEDGLAYDFSQVRVFTWNLKRHRYETAFRQRNLRGYLPVTVAQQTLDKAGPVPTFAFRQGIGDSVTIDPLTGAARPTSTETLTYRLDGALVKKVESSTAVPTRPVVAGPTAPSAGGKSRKRAIRARRHHRR